MYRERERDNACMYVYIYIYTYAYIYIYIHTYPDLEVPRGDLDPLRTGYVAVQPNGVDLGNIIYYKIM